MLGEADPAEGGAAASGDPDEASIHYLPEHRDTGLSQHECTIFLFNTFKVLL